MRPLSGSIAPRSVEALSTDVESPRVVLGVPPSSAPSRPPETLESETPPSVSTKADVSVTVDVVIPKLPSVSVIEPAEARPSVREALPPPAPSEPATTEPSAEAAPAFEAAPAEDAAEATAPQAVITEDAAAVALVAPTNPELTAPPPAVEPAAQASALAKQDVEEERAPDTQRSLAPQVLEPNVEEPASSLEAASGEPSIDPDDVSVPPIGDITVEKFFSDGDLSRHDLDASERESLTDGDKGARKSLPHVIERRARFARYVKWAVTGAAVVCLAAVGRTAFTSGAPTRAPAAAVANVAPPPVVAPVASPEPPVTKAAAVEAAPAPQPVATDDQAPAADDPEAADAVTGDAREEKETARKALERRKIADAIEAAARSVKLDASDAEAWLILGAAYLEKGNAVEARKAFASCVSEAKTGPRQECAKMLR